MENRALEPVKVEAVSWNNEEVETIKRTVAKDATDDELKMFLYLAGTYGLDPFARDIWFIKDKGGRPIIMTSRDGYQKIANRNPQYDNMEADVIYQGDTFRKTKDGVEHVYGTQNRGNPIGAYALVYRKDRNRPTYIYVPFNNYWRDTQVWRKYPHAMILKVAEAMALKRAFSISGLVTREEIGEEETLKQPETPEMPQPEPAKRAPDGSDLKEFKSNIYREYIKLCGNDRAAAQQEILRITEGRGSAAWTDEDLKWLQEDIDFKRHAIQKEIAEAEAEMNDNRIAAD